MRPGSTVLDIRAGTGAWSIPLAGRAARVTAVDIVTGSWPDVHVETHDYSLAAHSVYGSADLPRFVERMLALTRRTCFLVLHIPVVGGVMAEAAKGHRVRRLPGSRPCRKRRPDRPAGSVGATGPATLNTWS